MILLGSDNICSVTGLFDAVLQEYVNTATVSFTFTDLDGVTIATVSCSYVDASDGDYIGTLTAAQTSGMNEQQEYIRLAVASVGDYRHTWKDTDIAGYE